MREQSTSTDVRLPAEALWDFLADYDNVVRLGWEGASAHRIEDSEDGLVQYRASVKWEGIPNTHTAVLEEAERPRTVKWSTSSGGGRSWVWFDLVPLSDDSVRVTTTLSVRNSPAARALEPLAWGVLKSVFARTIAGLQELGPQEMR